MEKKSLLTLAECDIIFDKISTGFFFDGPHLQLRAVSDHAGAPTVDDYDGAVSDDDDDDDHDEYDEDDDDDDDVR